MADPADHPMADAAEQESTLQVSDDEQKALELWDRLQELQLEIAIINAHNSDQLGESASIYHHVWAKAYLCHQRR